MFERMRRANSSRSSSVKSSSSKSNCGGKQVCGAQERGSAKVWEGHFESWVLKGVISHRVILKVGLARTVVIQRI